MKAGEATRLLACTARQSPFQYRDQYSGEFARVLKFYLHKALPFPLLKTTWLLDIKFTLVLNSND